MRSRFFAPQKNIISAFKYGSVRLPWIYFYKMTSERFNIISGIIIKCAIEVHKELGKGFSESVYEVCMKHALNTAGLNFKSQVPVPVYFNGVKMEKEFFIDILVEGEIVVELKAVEALLPVHDAQLINYLRLSRKQLGLLLNFNIMLMKNGIRRIVNEFREDNTGAPRLPRSQ